MLECDKNLSDILTVNRVACVPEEICLEHVVAPIEANVAESHILIDGRFAVATNHHVMAICELDLQFSGKELLPVKAYLRAKEFIDTGVLFGKNDEGALKITSIDGEELGAALQTPDQYPNWRNGVKEASAEAVFGINMSVAVLKQVVSLFESDDMLRLEFTGTRNPVRVYSRVNKNVFVVAMPLEDKPFDKMDYFTELDILREVEYEKAKETGKGLAKIIDFMNGEPKEHP